MRLMHRPLRRRRDHLPGLVHTEHGRHPHRPSAALGREPPQMIVRQLVGEHVLVKKHDGIERLVLSGSGQTPPLGQMCEKGL